MIRIPVMALLTLLAVPFRILVTFWGAMVRRKNTVVVWELGGGRKAIEPKVFDRMLQTLAHLAEDQRISGLRIELRPLALGLAQVYRLREAINDVRLSGKRVEVHVDGLTDKSLLLASVATRISMCPASEVFLSGVASPVRFYGDALARVGISVDFESAGAYKSFGEVYTRGLPTVANREAMDHILGDLQNQWVAAVASARSIDVERVELALQQAPIPADKAAEIGLIDAVAYSDQDWDEWEQFLGKEPIEASFGGYGRLIRFRNRLPAVRRKKQRIAVVHLEGPVVERRSQMMRGGRMIASDDVVPVLDSLAENKAIKGVVLAVNSPGGSALASDLIARSVEALRDKKPVVAVFGNVAASGGYYISALAHEIWTHPATVTGSIGVVGGKVVLGDALAKLGIQTTWMGPAPDPGMMTAEAKFTEGQRIRFRASLKRVYDRFLAIVAKGRELEIEGVEAVAQGRVWTGIQAVENGLADRIGTLKQATARVAEIAGVKKERYRALPIRFEPPKFGALSQAVGARTELTFNVMDALLPEDSLTLQVVYSSPAEPLALMPGALDLDVLSAWCGGSPYASR